MIRYLLLLTFISFFNNLLLAQGTSCSSSTPFCTGTTYTFPSVTGNAGYGSVGCLNSTPNPSWFHFQMASSGNMTIKIQQGSNDIDFICWGPFSSANAGCTGTVPSGGGVSCSYSGNATEYCQINNATAGQWYILLITNFSGNSGNFTFTNTGGNATTNCCILQNTEAGNSFTKTCSSNPSGTNIGTSNTGGSSYSWSPSSGLSNASASNPVANPSSTTTYTLTETDGSGCVFSDVVTVNVNTTLPNTNAGSNVTTNCTTPARTLSGSGGGSYSWSPSAGLSNASSSNPSANPNATTTYTLTATGSNGCSKTDNVTVTVDKSPPTAGAGNNATTTCITSTSTLAGTGGGSYSWSPTTGLSNASIANPIANPTATTTYSLQVTAANGCTDTDNVTITVNETPPSVNAGANYTTNCTNPTFDISGSGSGTFSWSPSSGLSATNISNPTANPTATTTYTLEVTATNGCTSTDNVTIAVDKGLPNANAGADIELDCITTTGNFTASGGTTYDWRFPDGTSTGSLINFDDTNTPGEYIVNVTGANGCSLEDTTVLILNQTPPNANAGADITFNCTTNSGSFVATGGTSYSWLHPSGQTTTNSTINRILGDDIGDYTVTITSPNGCTVTDTASLTVDTIVPVSNAGIDTLLTCSHMNIDLNGTLSSNSSDIDYTWQTNNGNIVQNGTTTTPTINQVGLYYLTVLNTINNCFKIDSVQITIDTISPISMAGIDTIISCNIPVIELLGSGSSTGNFSYAWTTSDGNISTNGNTISPTIDAGGNYQLTVTNNYNGCTSNDFTFVAEDLTAVIDILSSDISIEEIEGIAAHDVEYSWVGDNGDVVWSFGDNNTSTDSSLTHTYNLRGEYVAYIQLTDERGCIAYDSITIKIDGRVIRFPNVFSPNNDGVNDLFTFRAETVVSFDCSIFNRWGQLVYSWNASSGGWDGRTLAGKEAPVGEYYYILHAVDRDSTKIEQKGILALKK